MKWIEGRDKYLLGPPDLSEKTTKIFPNNTHEQIVAVCGNKPSVITHTYTQRKVKGISITDIHAKKFLKGNLKAKIINDTKNS